jgi:hypothetical protein
MSLTNIKDHTDTLPHHLLQSLRNANIIETEPCIIKAKLKERTSSQIVSYLQLALIKLRQTSVAASEFSSKIKAQQERSAFGAVLEQHVQEMKQQ